MDPINYQTADPSAAILNGIKMGAGLQGLQEHAQDRQTQLLQQQNAQQYAQQQASDLHALALNPNATHADYASVMTKYPEIAEHLGKAFKTLDEGQQQNALQFGSRVYAAQLAGNNPLAAQMLRDRAAADPAQAQHYNTMADLVEQSPQTARAIGALSLASAMGPDKFAAAFTGLGADARAEQLQPAAVGKATGDAQEALAKGGAARQTVALGNEKTGEEILSAQAQRQVASFNAQIAAANSETERGRLTLERDKFVADQKLKTGQVAQDTQGQFDNLTQSIQTVQNLMAHPGLNSGTGMGGGVMSFFNGSDARDFRTQLETLKSQQFLAQAKEMKGMGALSDAEGARIERAVASLDPSMSTQQFKNNLGVILTTLQKGQSKLVASGKLPQTGGAFVMQHPQFGNVTDADVNRLMAQNPGSTRDQVLQFLRSTGGK